LLRALFNSLTTELAIIPSKAIKSHPSKEL